MYINVETLQYPVTEQDIRQSHPNTSFPTPFVPPVEYELVFPVPQPEYDTCTEGIREVAPAKTIKGVYEQQWEVYSLSDTQVEINTVSLRNSLLEQATSIRWQKETGGITVADGVKVRTSIEDQNRITSVIANAELAGVTTVDFKSESGWVTLTVEEVKAIAAAIATHVQACFSAERAHHEAIASLDLSQLKSYNVMQGWPA